MQEAVETKETKKRPYANLFDLLDHRKSAEYKEAKRARHNSGRTSYPSLGNNRRKTQHVS